MQVVILVQVDKPGMRRKRNEIAIFKVGDKWVFKHYFEDAETFKELAEYYDKDHYRFILKTLGERNKILKLLKKRGFDAEILESTKGHAVKLGKYKRYASMLKNSLAHIETSEWHIFLMKDRDSVDDALRHGAKLLEVEVKF